MESDFVARLDSFNACLNEIPRPTAAGNPRAPHAPTFLSLSPGNGYLDTSVAQRKIGRG
jgi:hypothetical protein